MASIKSERLLAETIRSRLDSFEPKRSQKWLAEQLGITPGELSKRLNEQKAMSDDEVAHIADILALPCPRLLLLAGMARCKVREHVIDRKVKTSDAPQKKRRWDLERQRHENARTAYRDLLSALDSPGVRPARAKRAYVSLEDFPDMVPGRWTVLVGDRRERPAKGLGDLVGLSIGSSDFMYLHQLPLPADTIVRSDKTLLIASEASLRELMKTNLLIIGSPAVSLGTRAVLRQVGATFMFNIGNDVYRREHDLYERLESPATREELGAFLELQDVREEIDDLLATFRKNGFVDPIDFKGIRGRAIGYYEDYGMVALARNPWSQEHIACICAGVHGGGTAGAVQLLASPDKFAEWPWGGVFRVSMSDQVAWEKRFENLAPRWETHFYDPNRYAAGIDQLISRAYSLGEGKKSDDQARQLDVSKEMLERVQNLTAWLMRGSKGEPQKPPEAPETAAR